MSRLLDLTEKRDWDDDYQIFSNSSRSHLSRPMFGRSNISRGMISRPSFGRPIAGMRNISPMDNIPVYDPRRRSTWAWDTYDANCFITHGQATHHFSMIARKQVENSFDRERGKRNEARIEERRRKRVLDEEEEMEERRLLGAETRKRLPNWSEEPFRRSDDGDASEGGSVAAAGSGTT
jgi:hypothetical protein